MMILSLSMMMMLKVLPGSAGEGWIHSARSCRRNQGQEYQDIRRGVSGDGQL